MYETKLKRNQSVLMAYPVPFFSRQNVTLRQTISTVCSVFSWMCWYVARGSLLQQYFGLKKHTIFFSGNPNETIVLFGNNIITGEQPLKLAHSLLGYAVGVTDIYRPGWPITRKQTHRNKLGQNLFPQEMAENLVQLSLSFVEATCNKIFLLKSYNITTMVYCCW